MLLRLFKKFARSGERVVIDTNVLVSGTIVRNGTSAQVVDAALAREISALMSDTLLEEYLYAIHRPHITRRYRTIAPRIQDIVEFLQKRAIRVQVQMIPSILDDPDDDFLLACAVEGKAAYIISGDEHLLALREYRGIKILTPRDFVLNVLHESIPVSR